MDRTITISISMLTFALTAGCGAGKDGSVIVDAGTLSPLQQLEAETGQAWTVRYHSDVHTPALLEGRTPPMAGSAGDAARAGREFFRRHAALFALGIDDDVDAQSAETDELGMTHARFVQRAQGHPVWGGELITHFARDGALVRINGRSIPIVAPLGEPTFTADAARVAAVNAARQRNGSVDPDAFTTYAPKLYAYPVDTQTTKLAWWVEVDVESDAGTPVLELFIDATDGSVLRRTDITNYLDGSGVGVFGDPQKLVVAENGAGYILEDASRGAPPARTYTASGRARLPVTPVRSKDPTRWDEAGDAHGAAVDAHAYLAATWDYFAKVHGRMGWEDEGRGVHATVHFGQRYANAFFNGRQVVFGDGDGRQLSPLSGALDVVAHEYTHGVTFHTARLGAEGQNGALNEAISDIFGCLVEGNWQMGEAVFHPAGRKQPLRDVAQPHATDNPETMAEYVETTDDNGGIHLNSTIVSHAAYLMTQGPHRLSRSTVEQIWYRALTRYLHSRADFADAADATLAAARDLGGDAEPTVREAWVAAGVLQ